MKIENRFRKFIPSRAAIRKAPLTDLKALHGMVICRLDLSTRPIAGRLNDMGAGFSASVVEGPASGLSGVKEITVKELPRYSDRPAWASDRRAAILLRKAGYRRIVDSATVREALPAAEYRIRKADFEKALPAIEATLGLFADRASRSLYVKLIRYRAAILFGLVQGGAANQLLPVPAGTSYFPDEFLRPEDFRDFVDCGAYTGDTLWYLLYRKSLPRIRNYYGFEPDPRNFSLLERNLKAMQPLAGNARLEPIAKALCDRTGRIGFRAQADDLSRIDRTSRKNVAAIRLDDYLGNRPVSFLKIEAEGDEIAALKGAVRSIRKWKPFLAVTVYHEAQDLWEIPPVIKEIDPRYRLFLRHHDWDQSRTICYGMNQ